MKKMYETAELTIWRLEERDVFLLTSTEEEKADNYFGDDFDDYGNSGN